MVHADRLPVGSTRGLYALDKLNGPVVWHIESRHTLFSPTPAESAYASGVHGELYTIEPANGRILPQRGTRRRHDISDGTDSLERNRTSTWRST